MAVARIITGDPRSAERAADYLRSRGYDVEMFSPGQGAAVPADIELDLQGLTRDEALAHAIEADETSEPRTKARGRRAVAYDITGRPVEFVSDDDTGTSEDARGSAAARVREMLGSLALPFSRVREWIGESRKAAAERRAARDQQRVEEETRLAEEGRRKQEEIALQLQQEEEAHSAAELERSRRAEAEGQKQAALERERAARRWEEEQLRAQERERAEHEALIERERKQREAEEASRAERELAQRRQELQQAQLAAAREQRKKQEAARDLVEQFRREARVDARREQFAVEQAQAEQRIDPAEALLGHRERHQAPTPSLPHPPSQRDRDWKKAAVAGVAIALLATLSYAAYQNRTPATPLANRDLVRSQSISEPVPFGTATIAPQQSPTLPQLPQRLVAPPTTTQQVQAPAPHPKKRTSRHARAYRDDSVADDEVVVHHRTSSSSTTSAKSDSSPKRFSDLEQ